MSLLKEKADLDTEYRKQSNNSEQKIELLKKKRLVNKNIQDKFNEAGVEIMSPDYNAMRDGNEATLPEQYIGKEYKIPSFRINLLNRPKKEEPPHEESH